jgi:hypothetical protein
MSCVQWLVMQTNSFRCGNLFAVLAGITFASVAFNARSEAKIVYTPVNVTTAGNGHMQVDVNHDGLKDFAIQAAVAGVYCGTGGGGVHAVVTVTPTTGDGVVANAGNAAALASGVSVGPPLTFYKYQALMTNSLLSRGCGSYRYGSWCSGYAYSCRKTAYLGLKFLVNGQTHYGWAYVTISANIFGGSLSTTLQGFAFETIAGQGIKTGQTSGT